MLAAGTQLAEAQYQRLGQEAQIALDDLLQDAIRAAQQVQRVRPAHWTYYNRIG